MNEDEIKELLERYSKNLCSPEERKLIEHNILKNPVRKKWDWQDEAHKNRIDERIRDGLPMLESKPTNNWLGLIAGLAAVMLIGLTVWSVRNRYLPKPHTVIAEAISHEQAETTLTLPDGKSLAVNSKIDVRALDSILARTTFEDKEIWLTVSVPNGKNQEIILADGSSVWLNAGSTLQFPQTFPNNQRHVHLEGEGYFDVASDPDRHFHVFAGKGKVVVTGTIFNIQAYKDQKTIRTSLIEGGVNFHIDEQEHQLTPGNELIADVEHGQTKVQRFDIDRITFWKDGYFKFDDTDLVDVLKMVSRWYNVTIISNVELLNKPVGGTFPKDLPLEELLKDLSILSKVNFEIQGKEVHIIK